MPITDGTLDSWSRQGSIQGSKDTHESIRDALSAYTWPSSMRPTLYLQGSYANSTNIRGDSDVDLVAQTEGVFWSNLAEDEKRTLHLAPAPFSFTDYRQHALAALRARYESSTVDATSSANAIKIDGRAGRLPADVIVCGTYKRYDKLQVAAEGIIFWSADGSTVINYPKLHLQHGFDKNARCDGNYKRMVRVFKNARNALPPEVAETAPSYFLECLLYNVDDECFVADPGRSMYLILEHLAARRDQGSLVRMTAQNHQTRLFGPSAQQWGEAQAALVISKLIELWNNWKA